MRRLLLFGALALAVVGGGIAIAAVPLAKPTSETEPFFDENDEDADDPAIWVHPTDGSKGVVIGTLKNGGLAVFDLAAKTIQRWDDTNEDARQNNVDVLYGVTLGGVTRDLAVVTDRGLDHLRVFAIDPRGADAGADVLREVTEANPVEVFPGGDDEVSAYGIAAWKGTDGAGYVAVSQRHQTRIALLRLVARGAGVGFDVLDTVDLPSTFALGGGRTWAPCVEEDGEAPQVEGMVADSRRGFLFAAQEDVGLWRIPVSGERFAAPRLFDRVREFGQPYTREPGEDDGEFECEIDTSAPTFGSDHLVADAEGLTIYRLRGATGYLLASSQGSSTFAVYDLTSLALRGTFGIGPAGSIDAVDESDGAMVSNLPLGPFDEGLLVTHDGVDEPLEDTTNFTFTRWDDVADLLGLEIDTASGDPRR